MGEIERYKLRYGVDLTDPDNYDLIIDTSYSNTEELADIIIQGEESYRKEEYYPKNWASPAPSEVKKNNMLDKNEGR